METDGAEEKKRELAELVVGLLEVGTGKEASDVPALCARLGVDYAALRRSIPRSKPKLRMALSNAIASAAASPETLLSDVVKIGADFLGMLEGIYSVLADHSTSEAGTSKEFRFRRDGLILDLPISSEFIEQIRSVHRELMARETGTIDDALINDFLGADNGEFYGRWPLKDWKSGFALPWALTQIAWLKREVQKRTSDRRWRDAQLRLQQAEAAGRALVDEAMLLVEAYALGSGSLLRTEGDRHGRDRIVTKGARLRLGTVLIDDERRRGTLSFELDALIAAAPASGSASGLIYRITDDEDVYSGVESLAALCGIWKRGILLDSERLNERLKSLLTADDVGGIEAWLASFVEAAASAASWFRNKVWTTTGSSSVTVLIERLDEYLKLPLWRERSLLYEIWVLCQALRSVDQGGWDAKLALEDTDGLWVLPVSQATSPIATLSNRRIASTYADVWREPLRNTSHGKLTPDITISRSNGGRDLVTIECKDRFEMPAGISGKLSWRRTYTALQDRPKHALAVAQKYRQALDAEVTWVVNYCEFRDDAGPNRNHGDGWNAIFLGGGFRPGHIPESFSTTIVQALLPIELRQAVATTIELVLVLDTTGSMHSRLTEVTLPKLREPEVVAALEGTFVSFRAVLFTDHGAREPYLLHEIGPHTDLAALLEAIEGQPLGSGDDEPEALEDAVQRCCELVDGGVRGCFLLLTDAPPHTPEECPRSIRFDSEVQRLLASSPIGLVESWLTPDADAVWQPYASHPSLHRLAIDQVELIAEIARARFDVPLPIRSRLVQ